MSAQSIEAPLHWHWGATAGAGCKADLGGSADSRMLVAFDSNVCRLLKRVRWERTSSVAAVLGWGLVKTSRDGVFGMGSRRLDGWLVCRTG